MDHFELASALRGVVSDLQKRLRKQTYSADELSLTESHTLSYLYKKGSLFPSELAELNKIKKQSMSQALNRLEELKLIKRVVSKEDKRKTAISLTPAAEKIVEKSRHERDEWLAGAMKATITEKDMRVIEAAIPLLVRIADAR
ncbi:MAG TPA: MarR family transcriptional regulator [Puia sp.]|nr:MarR family transcriptional regulator [Puia sp.]